MATEAALVFRALVKAAGSVVWRADAAGRVEALEPPDAVTGLQGWLGHGWKHALHPEDARAVFNAWRAARRNPRLIELKHRLRRDDGQYRWYRVRGTPIVAASGEVQWVGVVADCDDLVRAHAELERSELAYRALVEATSALVWRADASGAMTEARGWASYASYRGDAWLEAVHPDDRAETRDWWARTIRSGQASAREFRARDEQGAFRHCAARAVPVRSGDGRVAEWVATLTDIHEEKIARQALARSERLKTVGRLTAGIAHDFNNLLTVIMSASESLALTLPSDSPGRSQADLALRAAERGADLVSRLLAFSRNQPLRPEPVRVQGLLNNLLSLVRPAVSEDIQLVFTAPGGGLRCLADPAQLEAALMNLVMNARDAMPDGGAIRVSAAPVTLGKADAAPLGLTPGAYVAFAVEDEGSGMSSNVLEHAIEPFFTTKAPGHGSGLGLSMVYGFAKQSAGHLAIASREAEGTQVRMLIPAAPNEAGDGPRPVKARPARARQARILVVEDDDLVRENIAQRLTELGYRVLAVGDGPAALDLLGGARRFDLLFTDVVMPGGMNGRQLADHARVIRPHLPVLLTSGYTDDAVLLKDGLADARTRFLAKPYNLVTLAEAIDLLLATAPAAAA